MALLAQIGELGSVGGSIGLANQVGRLFIPRDYKIGDISIDTIISEEHQSTASVTKYPTESGVTISDHTVVDPYSVTIRGLISDISSNEFADYAMIGVAKDAIDAVSGLFSGNDGEKKQNSRSLTRSQEIWRQLQNAQKSGQTLTFHSQLRDYENMIISSLSCTQDVNTKMVVSFTATLTQIVTVDFLEVASGDSLTGLTSVSSAETEIAENNQNTDDRLKTTSDSGTKKGSSGLYDLYKNIGG